MRTRHQKENKRSHGIHFAISVELVSTRVRVDLLVALVLGAKRPLVLRQILEQQLRLEEVHSARVVCAWRASSISKAF